MLSQAEAILFCTETGSRVALGRSFWILSRAPRTGLARRSFPGPLAMPGNSIASSGLKYRDFQVTTALLWTSRKQPAHQQASAVSLIKVLIKSCPARGLR